jgi:hypothetical protein
LELAPLWARPLIAGDALAFYVYKLVFPVSLAMDYGRRPVAVLQEGWAYWTWWAPVTIGIAILAVRKQYPWLVCASLLFVIGAAANQRELTTFARDSMSSTQNSSPLLAAAVLYLIITLPLTRLVARLERRTQKAR